MKNKSEKKIQELQYDDEGNVIGNNNDRRLAFLQDITDGLDEDRQGELRDIVSMETGETQPFSLETSENEKGTDGQTREASETKENASARALLEEHERQEAERGLQDPEVRHTIKVNGKELSLTTAELIARAQKVESADDYLATAKRQAESVTPPVEPPKAPPSADVEPEEMIVARLARALQVGSEEEATAAIQFLLHRGPSQDDLARTVDARLTFAEANKKFNDTYPDIVKDPVLYNMARARDAELRAAGDSRPFWDRFNQIGTEINTWLQSKTMTKESVKEATPPKVEVSQERVARKKDVPAVPRPASGRADVDKNAEEPEQTVSDIISEIAKARGGPQWMGGRTVQ